MVVQQPCEFYSKTMEFDNQRNTMYAQKDDGFVSGQIQPDVPAFGIGMPRPEDSDNCSQKSVHPFPANSVSRSDVISSDFGCETMEARPYFSSGAGQASVHGSGAMWNGRCSPAGYCSTSYHGPMQAHPYDRYRSNDIEGAQRKNTARESTNTLKTWLQEHNKNPYPSKGEKIMLAIVTKMTLTQVSTWFANARRRLKKENKMTWLPKNRSGEVAASKAEESQLSKEEEEEETLDKEHNAAAKDFDESKCSNDPENLTTTALISLDKDELASPDAPITMLSSSDSANKAIWSPVRRPSYQTNHSVLSSAPTFNNQLLTDNHNVQNFIPSPVMMSETNQVRQSYPQTWPNQHFSTTSFDNNKTFHDNNNFARRAPKHIIQQPSEIICRHGQYEGATFGVSATSQVFHHSPSLMPAQSQYSCSEPQQSPKYFRQTNRNEAFTNYCPQQESNPLPTGYFNSEEHVQNSSMLNGTSPSQGFANPQFSCFSRRTSACELAPSQVDSAAPPRGASGYVTSYFSQCFDQQANNSNACCISSPTQCDGVADWNTIWPSQSHGQHAASSSEESMNSAIELSPGLCGANIEMQSKNSVMAELPVR